MSEKSFYITTTLPYVNAEAHLGHALEFIRADIIARFKKSQGYEIFFNTGTDEHGQKILKASQATSKSPQEYTDEYAAKFRDLLPKLGLLSETHFIRTTEERHVKAAQEFWNRVSSNGFIYKKNYKVKYCYGCEAQKTESEIVDGHCELHPNLDLEIREEENYFFKFSQFQDKLLALYERDSFVVPEERFHEMKEFVKRGLEDFSISRLKEKMSWGVPVPGDEAHVMYVWFDALTSYISTLGWPDEGVFKTFWIEGTPTQYCGKDNTRFQAAMWQAMLMAAGLPNSSQIVVNGFVTGEGGVKMSKSLGNVTDPLSLIDGYGTDALRYFVSRELSTFEDSPYSDARFKEAYNANLANGLGNLLSRVMKLAQVHLDGPVRVESHIPITYTEALEKFEIKRAADLIWEKVVEADKEMQDRQPFKLIKTDREEAIRAIEDLVKKLSLIADMLAPFMPLTSKKMKDAILENKMPEQPLFPRKD